MGGRWGTEKQNVRLLADVLFVGSRWLPTLPGSQFAIVALLRIRLHRSLLTGLAARFIAHWARSPPPFASQVLRTIWRKPECVLICQNLTNRNTHAMHGRFCFLDPGGYLLSRTVASQVPSAYEGLTSVFGMGTGGTLQLNHRKGVVFVNTLKTA